MDTQPSTHKNSKKRWLKAFALLLLALIAGTIAYLASVESQARHLWKMRVQATHKSRVAKSLSSEYDSFMQEYGDHPDVLIRRRVAETRFHRTNAMYGDRQILAYANFVYEYKDDPDPRIRKLAEKAESERQWFQGLHNREFGQLLLIDRKRLLAYFQRTSRNDITFFGSRDEAEFNSILKSLSDDDSAEAQELVMKIHYAFATAMPKSLHPDHTLEAFFHRYRTQPMFWTSPIAFNVFKSKMREASGTAERLMIMKEFIAGFEKYEQPYDLCQVMLRKAEELRDASERSAIYDAVIALADKIGASYLFFSAINAYVGKALIATDVDEKIGYLKTAMEKYAVFRYETGNTFAFGEVFELLEKLTGRTDWEQTYFTQRYSREISESKELLDTRQYDLLIENYTHCYNNNAQGFVRIALSMKALETKDDKEKACMYDAILHSYKPKYGNPGEYFNSLSPAYALAICGKAELAEDRGEKLKLYKDLIDTARLTRWIAPFAFSYLRLAVQNFIEMETDRECKATILDDLLTKLCLYDSLGFAIPAIVTTLHGKMKTEGDELEKALLRAEIIEYSYSGNIAEGFEAVTAAKQGDLLPFHLWALH